MNKHGNIIEFRLINKDFSYFTGNSEFYNFLGDRLYSTLDRLMTEGSVKVLEKVVAERSYGVPFVLGLYAADGEPHTMVCRILDIGDPESVLMRMIELDEIVDEYLAAELERDETNALLSQRDCVYYSYDRPTDTMTCYRCDHERKKLCELELDNWRIAAFSQLPEESREEIEALTHDLKNGTRSFVGTFSKGIENLVIYTGTAVYNEDVHIKTVGSFGSGEVDPLRELVRRDQLTGLILKEDITNYAKHSVDDLKQKTAIAIVDIDDFKYVNDHWGHSAGDAVLKKCAAVIEDETGAYGKAGRIGGDEFFIVFDNIPDKNKLKYVLMAIKNKIADAYSEERDGFRVTTSIGASVYPEDTEDFDSLFRLTDYMLYRAKHKGKNRYIIYKREKHGSVEDILSSDIETTGISGRKGLSKSDVVCRIIEMLLRGEKYPVDNIIKDIKDHFGVERVILYDKTSRTAVTQCGNDPLDSSVIAETIDYIYDEGLADHRKNGAIVVNNIKTFVIKSPRLYEKLHRQGIYSFIHREIIGKSGKCFVLSCEAISAQLTWNLEDMRLYAILDAILSSML